MNGKSHRENSVWQRRKERHIVGVGAIGRQIRNGYVRAECPQPSPFLEFVGLCQVSTSWKFPHQSWLRLYHGDLRRRRKDRKGRHGVTEGRPHRGRRMISLSRLVCTTHQAGKQNHTWDRRSETEIHEEVRRKTRKEKEELEMIRLNRNHVVCDNPSVLEVVN